jgi:hypothetical protein
MSREKWTSMRTFEQSRKWITSQINLSRASADQWLLLGEAASKCEHLARVPLRPEAASALPRQGRRRDHGHRRRHSDRGGGAQGSGGASRRAALEGVPEAGGRKHHLGLQSNRRTDRRERSPAVTPATVFDYNRQIILDLPHDPNASPPGGVRQHEVTVGNACRGAPHEDCAYLVGRLCDWLAGPDFKAAPGRETVYAIIQAVVAHLYLAWIHPFAAATGVLRAWLNSTGCSLPACHRRKRIC